MTRAVIAPVGVDTTSMPVAIARIALRELTTAELERHIADCGRRLVAAHERFVSFGDPNDHEEALMWLHMQNEAILARSPATQAARHADFERRLAGGGFDA